MIYHDHGIRSLDATKARNILLSRDSPEVRKTRKSPSTRARNRLRLERFLAKKKASTVPATSSPEPDCRGCPLELLGIASNQTAPDGKGRTSSEINLTTTSQASEGQRLVLRGSKSKRISEIQQTAEAEGGGGLDYSSSRGERTQKERAQVA